MKSNYIWMLFLVCEGQQKEEERSNLVWTACNSLNVGHFNLSKIDAYKKTTKQNKKSVIKT